MISILLPSRGRPELLERFLYEAYTHASDWQNVQAIVRLDEDDAHKYMPGWTSHPGPPQFIIGKPGVGMGGMTNECLKHAHGGIIMLAGDDLVIRTPGWDEMVAEAMPADGIGLVFGNDLFQGPNLATHPFIGRAAINAWGGQVVPDDYRSEFIDTHIMDTFGRLGRLGHRRIAYLPDMVTEHMHHLNGKAKLDATYQKPMSFKASAHVYESHAATRQRNAEAMATRIQEANA